MDLIIESTFETPTVRFDETTGDFVICGRAIPDAENSFWKNVQSWVSDNISSIHTPITLKVEIEYMNARSINELMNLIALLRVVKNHGYPFVIDWVCDKNEQNEIYLIGQDIADATNCSIKFIDSVESHH